MRFGTRKKEKMEKNMKWFTVFMVWCCTVSSAVFCGVSTRSKSERIEAVVRILQEQPDSIEGWCQDRVYIYPERITINKGGVFVCKQNLSVQIPSFAIDDHGVFVLCTQAEAQEHYGKAGEAFRDAVGHSLGAGAAFAAEQPVLGVYEGYRAVEKWKEFGREYHAGVDAERESSGTVPSGPDRDK